MPDSYLHQTTDLLRQDFALEAGPEPMSEAELLDWLSAQVDYQLTHRRDWLMSLLYRLDVKEELVDAALRPDAPEPANRGLARLLYQRQRQRAHTKATIKSPEIDEDSLRW